MEKWSSNEVEELKCFYQENNVPSDQLVKDKRALDTFTANFNNRVNPNENFSPKEVADQLFKLRKSGKLPRVRK
jgi:hypothetical protein